MSIIQVKGTGKNLAERSSFYGSSVPLEIKRSIKPLKKLDQKTFRSLLQIVVKDFEGKDIPENIFDQLVNDTITEELLAFIFAGLFKLLKIALRIPQSSLKQENFIEDLQELGVPQEFIPDLSSVVFGSRRPHIDACFSNSKPKLPNLESFRWRVDVAISTSLLNRALQPSILVEMTLSDGKIHQFQVDVSKFHELRYNVSAVLKEIEDVEKRSILKIQDKAR